MTSPTTNPNISPRKAPKPPFVPDVTNSEPPKTQLSKAELNGPIKTLIVREAEKLPPDIHTSSKEGVTMEVDVEKLLPSFCKTSLPYLRVKRLFPNAQLPERKRPSDAGFDLFAYGTGTYVNVSTMGYRTGIAVAIPTGHVGLIRERSSVLKYGVNLIGGVIDEGYTGEITVLFRVANPNMPQYTRGDRIAQLLIVPVAKLTGVVEVDDLGTTDRGDKGFGSSGN